MSVRRVGAVPPRPSRVEAADIGSVWTILGQPVSMPPLQNLSLRNAASTAGFEERSTFVTDIVFYKWASRSIPPDVRAVINAQAASAEMDEQDIVIALGVRNCTDPVDRLQLVTELGKRFEAALKSYKPRLTAADGALFQPPLLASTVSECAPSTSTSYMFWYTKDAEQWKLLWSILQGASVDTTQGATALAGETLRVVAAKAWGPMGSPVAIPQPPGSGGLVDNYTYNLNSRSGLFRPTMNQQGVKYKKKEQEVAPDMTFKPFESFVWTREGRGGGNAAGKRVKKGPAAAAAQ